eukprot:Em0003g691a
MTEASQLNTELNSSEGKKTGDHDESHRHHHQYWKKGHKPTIEDLKKEIRMDEHTIPLEELLTRLGTNIKSGLTNGEARSRLNTRGRNALTPPKQTPEIIKFLKNMTGGFSLLFAAGAVLSLIAYGIQEAVAPGPKDNLIIGVALILIVIITGLFTHYQESKSEKIMKGFLKLVPQKALVLREGVHRDVRAERLVVGDIVEVKFGDRLPADVRILKSSGFKVDNSALTGESEPQSRSPDSSHSNPLESKNLAFFSTNAVEGTCTGVVIRTGDHTVVGRIAQLTGSIAQEKTTLAIEIEHVVRLIVAFALVSGITFFVVALAIGYSLLNSFIFFIGIAIANVPDGLLPAVTVCLTLIAQRMKTKNCLIRKLEAVETLGSTSVICTDKTGTLTENRMTVSHLWYEGSIHDVSSDLCLTEPQTAKRTPSIGWDALSRVMGLCNRATFKENQEHIAIMDRVCNGDASESALLKCFELEVGSISAFRVKYPKLFELPFNSTNKYQLSVHTQPDGAGLILVIKGAPEKILQLSTSYLDNGGKEQLVTPEFVTQFEETYAKLGNMGERVLGFAHQFLDTSLYTKDFDFESIRPETLLGELCFVGLVSLIDPPRQSVPMAVSKCRSAGIKVIMVTGDHPLTAKAIGRKVGIISPGIYAVDEIPGADPFTILQQPNLAKRTLAVVVHGSELAEMSDAQVDYILANYPEIVFARTSPTQKLRIVEGCQRAGFVVAVTGDGVNDAPALRKANIGIAMGITGTDVSKQAASIILLDDNFATIVAAVEEGRLLFDNLKKTAAYMLTANVPEVTPFVFYVILNIPLPLGVLGTLLISIGTDIVPAISLAYERAECDIMARKPRDQKRDKLTSQKLIYQSYGQIGMFESAAGFMSYFVVMGENGFLPYTLIGLRKNWEDPNAIVTDSYGQDWGFAQRLNLQYLGFTAFFVAVVVSQWTDLMICRTRRNSFFQAGLRYENVGRWGGDGGRKEGNGL